MLKKVINSESLSKLRKSADLDKKKLSYAMVLLT